MNETWCTTDLKSHSKKETPPKTYIFKALQTNAYKESHCPKFPYVMHMRFNAKGAYRNT